MRITTTSDNGVRWMWTDGLAELGQTDFAVPLSWVEDDWRTVECERLLAFIESYLKIQPKRITADQTMAFGWTALCFRASRAEDGPAVAGKLIIQELADPWSDGPRDYQDGCYGSILLKRIQDRVIMRHHITGQSDAPFRFHHATICANLHPDMPAQFVMERVREPEGTSAKGTSGWLFGCMDDTHDHDRPESFLNAHLLHLVEQRKYIFPYLSMPVGSMVAFEADKVIVFAPGVEEGHAEMVNPFTDLGDPA